MNLFAFAVAAFVFVQVIDRLRLINWKTAKPATMLLHVAMAALALWVIYDSFAEYVEVFEWIALIVAILFLHLTRSDWRKGVPKYAKTAPTPLGEPEVPHHQ